MERGGQLPAVVGEMVAAAVGKFTDETVITQEAQMAGNAGRELLVGSPGAPCRGREFLLNSL